MEMFSGDWKAWYGTHDAPAPPEQVHSDVPVSLVVGVSPVHPANAVDVVYRVNSGPELTAGSTLARTDYARNQQFFCVDFPQFALGSCVQYAPVARKAGRRMEFRQGERFPSCFQVASPQVATAAKAGTAEMRYPYRMEFLTRVTADLEGDPTLIGETPGGFFANFPVSEGRCKGRIQGQVSRKSSDLIRLRPDGIGIQDIKMIITTTDGANILILGSGAIDFGSDGLMKVQKGQFPQAAPVVEGVRCLTADPKYSWLNRLQCVSIGYATPASVNYDIYGIESLATAPKWER